MSSKRAKPPSSPVVKPDTDDDLDFLTSAQTTGKLSQGTLYSKCVRVLKLGLPLGAALLLGAILLWPQLKNETNRFEVGISGLDPRHPNRLKVVNARYRGVTGDGRPYSVIAESAFEAPSNTDNDVITLEAPSADMLQADGAWVLGNAPEGSYDRGTQLLKLWGGVTIFHDNGYTFSSDTADIQMQAGLASGDTPAMAFGPGGEIESQDGFEITERGRRLFFKGKSKLILQPGESFDVSGS